jgi:hypothetical protein
MKIKNILSYLTLIILSCTACGSSKRHCDAYGSNSVETEEMYSDVYCSHNVSIVKYSTTTSFK